MATPTVTYVDSGTPAAGSTSVAPAFMSLTNWRAGDIALLEVTNKYPNNGPTTPSGWTLVNQTAGGAGASGADTGNVYRTVYSKVLDGTESGTVTVSIPSGNSAIANIHRFRPGLKGSTISVVGVGGTYDASGGVSWSATMGSTVNIQAGDLLAAFSSINTDAYQYSAELITAAGITFSAAVEVADGGVTNGDDTGAVFSTHAATAGSATVAPVYTMTASGTAASNPAGATVIVVLREVFGADSHGGNPAEPALRARNAEIARNAHDIWVPSVKQVHAEGFHWKGAKKHRGGQRGVGD